MWVYVYHKTYDEHEAMIVPDMEYPEQKDWVVRVVSILIQFVQLLKKI